MCFQWDYCVPKWDIIVNGDTTGYLISRKDQRRFIVMGLTTFHTSDGQGDAYIVRNQTIGGTTYHDALDENTQDAWKRENNSTDSTKEDERWVPENPGITTIHEEDGDPHSTNPVYLSVTSDEDLSQGGIPDEETIREQVEKSEITTTMNDQRRKDRMVKNIGIAWKNHTNRNTK